MPSSGSIALIAFGAVLTSVSGTAGSIVAGVGVVWEALMVYGASRP